MKSMGSRLAGNRRGTGGTGGNLVNSKCVTNKTQQTRHSATYLGTGGTGGEPAENNFFVQRFQQSAVI
jgi:hypothetical protein